MDYINKTISITESDLRKMDKIKRINLVNSIVGYRSANLIASKSKDGKTNLSIFNSVIHLSSSPAIIGFNQRPPTVPRHNYTNIKETSYYTINSIEKDYIQQAHYTSAKFPEDESEFEQCGFTEEYLDSFYAPFVKESKLKLAVKFIEEYEIKASNSIFVVGSIEAIYLPENAIMENGSVDLGSLNTVCLSGLNHYHEVKQIAGFDYARPGQLPKNKLS